MAGLIGKTKKPKHGLLRPKEFRRIVGKAGAVAIRFDWFFVGNIPNPLDCGLGML